jgi:hypothetical protein
MTNHERSILNYKRAPVTYIPTRHRGGEKVRPAHVLTKFELERVAAAEDKRRRKAARGW